MDQWCNGFGPVGTNLAFTSYNAVVSLEVEAEAFSSGFQKLTVLLVLLIMSIFRRPLPLIRRRLDWKRAAILFLPVLKWWNPCISRIRPRIQMRMRRPISSLDLLMTVNK